MKKNAFTLIEVLVILMVMTLVSGVAYRLMTGTFSQFFKSQTKLTNLRAASIILERLKADMRLALIPADSSEDPVIEPTRLRFCLIDEGQRRMVNYTFSDDTVKREVEGGANRVFSMATVSDFKVAESGAGDSRLVSVSIVVDNDKDNEGRSESDKGNKVELRAVMYPRFFAETITDEEKFWNLARHGTGGN
jgi:type II secretory pathway pseudopilin PulG